MARKDKPYLPLFVQDFLTDEKLMECSAEATGVYIRVMCILHKCEPYGKLLLRQKDRQTDSKLSDFATKLAKHLPYPLPTIVSGLEELTHEECLQIDGDYLLQKRMVADGELSLKRSKSGSEGAKIANENREKFAIAKPAANAEIETAIENGIVVIPGKEVKEKINITTAEIGSEKAKEIANEAWKDQSWRESICMGLSINQEDLKKWMALFNSSISNDTIADFDKSRYKKMIRGWISKQQSKGVKVGNGEEKKSNSAPLTIITK